jgi:hypothetical protein
MSTADFFLDYVFGKCRLLSRLKTVCPLPDAVHPPMDPPMAPPMDHYNFIRTNTSQS